MINSSLETCFSGNQQLGQLKNSCFIIAAAQNQKIKCAQGKPFFFKRTLPEWSQKFLNL